MMTTPSLFLSSLYSEHVALRARIAAKTGREVWVADVERPDLGVSTTDPLAIVDTLITAVRQSRGVICILGGHRDRNDHGTPIEFHGHVLRASYWEIELFQAAMLELPIFLLKSKGFAAGPRLRELLDLLAFEFPSSWTALPELSDDEISGEVERIVNGEIRDGGRVLSARQTTSVLVTRLDGIRSSRLQFLDGKQPPEAKSVDLGLVDAILDNAEASRNEESRLARLWLAARELLSEASPTECSLPLLPRWDRTLSQWIEAGSWYGLHGNLFLGPLAAINSLEAVKDRRAADSRSEPEFLKPHGSRASELYSTAKLLTIPHRRDACLSEALEATTRGLADPGTDQSNLLAVRGSILMAQGDLQTAIGVYSEVVRLRTSGGEADKIAEAESELGFALVLAGRSGEGLRLMEAAISGLTSRHRIGFLIRAHRKLGEARHLTGDVAGARLELRDAVNLATQYGLRGQLSQIEQRLASLDGGVGSPTKCG